MSGLLSRDDLTGLLPLGALESLALPGESYKLAFTPGLLTQVYGTASPTRCWPMPVCPQRRRGHLVDSLGAVLLPQVTDTPADELAFARQRFFPAPNPRSLRRHGLHEL